MTTTLENPPETTDPAAPARTRPSYDDINVPVVFLIAIISAVLTLLVIWLVEGMYYRWHSDLVLERKDNVVNTRQSDQIEAQKNQVTVGDPELGYEPLNSVIPDVVDKFKTGPNDGNRSDSGPDDNY